MPLTPQDMSYFKSWRWMYRFLMAARTDPEYRRAIWDYARIRVRDVLTTLGPGLQVGAGAAARPATIGDVFRSELNVAMVVRWQSASPRTWSRVARRATSFGDVVASAGITSVDTDSWGDADETRLTDGSWPPPGSRTRWARCATGRPGTRHRIRGASRST